MEEKVENYRKNRYRETRESLVEKRHTTQVSVVVSLTFNIRDALHIP